MNTFHTPHSIRSIFWPILLVVLSALTFLSCGEESLTGSQEDQSLSQSGNTMTSAQMQTQAMQMAKKASPEEISNAFFAMTDQVAAMSAAKIDSLSDQEILELGKPILDATAGTTTYPQATLEKVSLTLQKLADNPTKVNLDEHKRLSKEASRLMETDRLRAARQFSSLQLRTILQKMSRGSKSLSTTCADLFNQWGGYVHLYP